MIQDVTLTVLPGEEKNEDLIQKKIADALSINGKHIKADAITALIFRKKSIDARHGRIQIHLCYTAYVGEKPPADAEKSGNASAAAAFIPSWKKADPTRRTVIIGSGPAGLFAALRLLEDGITPIIVERGKQTEERKKDIAQISRQQTINSESNYCFGEGGAGTFSDGKLYSRSNKRGNIGRILAIFHYHGTDAEILTDAQPHIGTDKLPGIINRMRETICSFGGEFRFNTRCTNLLITAGRVTAVETTGSDGQKETIAADAVLLATGHSARDIYEMLARIDLELRSSDTGSVIEAKTFAMGVRVEHPRELIDKIQYHGQERGTVLPAATYRLATQVDERGVYSFCMCPGGLIVPSATADDEIVVNGMSPSSRDSRWSNAAIVVETRPEDIPAEFRNGSKSEDGHPALSGLRFQRWLEQEAKRHGAGQKAPAQRLLDFIAGKDSTSIPECSYSPGIVSSRLDRWLPPQIADRLAEAFVEYNHNMKGFICPEAVLVGVETRTSSPVRILRDAETLESSRIACLYPAGEGSGYAGGIVSSAMDGERCAEAICKKIKKS